MSDSYDTVKVHFTKSLLETLTKKTFLFYKQKHKSAAIYTAYNESLVTTK